MMGQDKIDLMWTDPPYGVEYQGGTADHLEIENDTAEGLPDLLKGAFATADHFMREGCPFYIAHPHGPLSLEFGLAVNHVGWKWHQTLVWVKDRLALGHSDYHYRHEPVLYGWKEGKKHPWYTGRAENTVHEFDKPSSSKLHPTMKPLELVAYHIKNSSRLNDIVYEPFCGSGTTLIVCEQLGRRCRGLELSPRYCDVIVQRWMTMTNRDAIRQDGTVFKANMPLLAEHITDELPTPEDLVGMKRLWTKLSAMEWTEIQYTDLWFGTTIVVPVPIMSTRPRMKRVANKIAHLKLWVILNECERIPRGYGLAYADFYWAKGTAVIVPFNWPAYWLIRAYRAILRGPKQRHLKHISIGATDHEVMDYNGRAKGN